ncbi:hypothetical protein DOY81_007022 [Sarcophaga bullata]|nr:hypothetical protein DOY81_007022 [Sarcophaga bullata]
MVSNPRCDVWNYFDNILEEGAAVCKLCHHRLKNDRSYSLRKHIKTMHNTDSEIWNYFKNISGEGVAVCKICEKHVRTNRRFNLTRHLKGLHGIEVDKNPDSQEDEAGNRANKRKLAQTEDSTASKSSKRCLYVEIDKEIVTRSVLGLLLEEGVQPRVFGSANMQALLMPICEGLCEEANKTLKIDEIETERVISSLATHLRNTFTNELHWRLLSLKIDADVNATSNSYCLSALFVDNGELKTYALGIIDLGDKTCLREENIKDILHKFNIDSNQIISAYCDDTKAHYNEPVENCNYLDKINQFEIFHEITLGDIKVERYVGTTIQHCILDLFKNNSIFQSFLQCRNMVKFLQNSHEYQELFKENNFNIPQLDSPWKWGSTYTMMKHLEDSCNVLKTINYESNVSSEDNFNLDNNLWAFIRSYCKVLYTVQKTLIRCYSTDMHFGDFYAQFLKSKLFVEKILNEKKHQDNYVQVIGETLLESIRKRLDSFLKHERFVACLYLDPRFQHTLNTSQRALAHSFLKKLWTRSKIYNIDMTNSAARYKDNQEKGQEHEDQDDEDTFLNNFLTQNIQNADSREAEIYFKFETLKLPFQTVDVNILKFWKELSVREPEIYALSQICFAIPATQVYNRTLCTEIYKIGKYETASAFAKENRSIVRLNYHLIKDVSETMVFFVNQKNHPKTMKNSLMFKIKILKLFII